MKPTNKRTWIFIAIIVGIIAIPVIFNFILQLPAFMPVIGDSIVWLSFWSSYLAAIASMCMVYFAYKTIRESLNEHKQNLRTNHHVYLRETLVGIQDTLSPVFYMNVVQELSEKKYTHAKEQLMMVQRRYAAERTKLTYILLDIDELDQDNQGKKYMTRINSSLTPIVRFTETLTAYAVYCEGIENDLYQGLSKEQILADQRPEIQEILSSKIHPDTNTAACMELQKKLNAIDWDELDTCLCSVYTEDQKIVKALCMMAYSSPIRK